MQTFLTLANWLHSRLRSMLKLPALPANDLLRDANYRRIFASVVITHFGAQITMLALPLTAATVLNASPTQMGFLMPFAFVRTIHSTWVFGVQLRASRSPARL